MILGLENLSLWQKLSFFDDSILRNEIMILSKFFQIKKNNVPAYFKAEPL